MSLTRRQALQIGAATVIAPVRALGAAQATSVPAARPRIRFAVSTYSYWHFKTEKYPIERVIEQAAALGFDGVEILHRGMASEEPAYLNGLKKLA
jgi:hypothetical protein